MAIAGTSTSPPLPQTTNPSELMPALQQLVTTLASLIQVLQAKLVPAGDSLAGGQAGAGAATTGGGPGTCSCGAGDSVGGADALDSTPPFAPVETVPQSKQGGESGRADTGTAEQASAAKTSNDPPAPSSKGQQIVEYAKQQLGKPYRFGASGPTAFDCSGLTRAALKLVGVTVPHKARSQSKMGEAVDKANLQPGDLVFFNTSDDGGVGHTGIYIGGGKFIHAPKTGDVVKVSSLSEKYYTGVYAGARRFA